MKLKNLKVRYKLILITVISVISCSIIGVFGGLAVDNMLDHALLYATDDFAVGELTRFCNRSIIFIVALTVFCSGLMIFLLTKINFDIGINLQKILSYVGIMSTGDLRVQDMNGINKRRDDFGLLAKSVEQMRSNISNIINDTKSVSEELAESVKNIDSSLQTISLDMSDISATTEQMSAGMEETSASASDILTLTSKISAEMDETYDKAIDGKNTLLTLREESESSKAIIERNKAHMMQTLSEVHASLEKALNDVEVVEDIHLLTESIMNISGETNLLSLNASIEAARAGEAGRGFAVVAEEIRRLATQSKESATQITSVVQRVDDAVHSLADNANLLLEFVNTETSKTLEDFGDFTSAYVDRVGTLTEVVSSFADTSEALKKSVSSMTDAIGSISKANEESTLGVINVAERVQNISSSLINLSDVSNLTNQKAIALQDGVTKFKI